MVLILQLPPLRAIGINDATIEKLRAEQRKLNREHALAEAEVGTLEARMPQARDADLLAAARALRSGKKAAAPRSEEKLLEEVKDARRRRDTLAVALADVEGEISAFLSEHAEDLINQIREGLAHCNNRQQNAVSEIEAARGQRLQADRATSWLSRFCPAPATAPATGTGSDYTEVIWTSATDIRPTDQEITRVLSYLRYEAGDEGGLEALRAATPSDLVSVIHPGEVEVDSWKKQFEARRAAFAEANQ